MLRISFFLLLFFFQSAFAQNSKYETGDKLKGQKNGVWKYYDSPENLSLIFDHSKNRIIFSKNDTAKTLVKVGGEWVRMKMDQKPRYLGSYEIFYQLFHSKLPFPKELLRLNLGGSKLYLGFEVSLDGKARNATVINTEDEFTKKYIIQAFDQISGDWIIAEKNGVKYSSILSIPVVFCAECSGFTPSITEKEDKSLSCEILPQIMIQKNSYGRKIMAGENRNQVILNKENKRFYELLFTYPHSTAAWSTNAEEIAFIRDNNVFVKDLISTHTRQVTNSLFHKNSILWTEKGIAFEQENNFGVSEIMLYNVEKDSIINLSNELKWSEVNPIYNKFSNSILVTSAKNHNQQLYSLDLDNYRKTQITNFSNRILNPLVSPVKNVVAFIEQVPTKGFVIRLQGINEKDSVSKYFGRVNLIGWSPDGKKLLLSSYEKGQNDFSYRTNLQTFDLKTKVHADISPLYTYIGKSIWSDLGIFFEADGKLRILDPKGSNKKIVDVDFNHWDINGTKILFAKKGELKIYDLLTNKIEKLSSTNNSTDP